MVIAYLMWTHRWDFERAFAHTRERRGIISPNAGFTCRLIELGQRLAQLRAHVPLAPRLFRMVPWFSAPMPKLIEEAHVGVSMPASTQLDSRTCFVLQASDGLHVWLGDSSHAAYCTAAKAWARLLCRFEGATAPQLEPQGAESDTFWAALGGRAPVLEARGEYDDDYGAGQGPTREPLARSASIMPGACTTTLAPRPCGKTPRGGAGSCTFQSEIEPSEISRDVSIAELYALPDIEPLSMFDSDDLMPDGVFVLLVRGCGGKPEHASLWVGSEVEGKPEQFAEARKLLARLGSAEGLPLAVVAQGNEDEAFWARFVNG